MEQIETDWKLKLRYGKLKTPYQHYSIISEGVVEELSEGFECPKGDAFMAMKIWAEDMEQAADLFTYVSSQIGFQIKGKLETWETDPNEPPRDNPHGYDIKFTPFESA
ncbi:hypothetical protein [Kiloniella sp. EL199]|uniref:hypothetical protein n=1 Tax=Kiloniella sp. EL199 TaxID=2107581 RepID=UPI000EA2ECC5|nr:hypothetical protein [Kiloniella sp. EL199]